MRVIDIYFECFGDEADLGMLFNDKQARYYDEGVEVSFFNSYYFCDSLVCNDINNLIFMLQNYYIFVKKIKNIAKS